MNLSREQIRCLESPTKASIFAALRVLKQATAKEISAMVGGSANGLYQHLRQMIDVGLVVVAESRPAETKPESVYELSAAEFFMNPQDQEYRESVFRSAKNISRLAQRHYERALSDPAQAPALGFNFASVRLSNERLAQLKEDLQNLLLAAMSDHDPEGIAVIYAGLLAPTEQK